MASQLRVTARNARFQQWAALLTNRSKRQRAGAFLVQGVRPITMAIRSGWEIRELLYDADPRLPDWARETLDRVRAPRFAVAGIVLVGTDERGEADVAGWDFARPTVVVVGNETSGLSAAWREACDHLLRIPMAGSASSLNAATAASIVMYERVRQRRMSTVDE